MRLSTSLALFTFVTISAVSAKPGASKCYNPDHLDRYCVWNKPDGTKKCVAWGNSVCDGPKCTDSVLECKKGKWVKTGETCGDLDLCPDGTD